MTSRASRALGRAERWAARPRRPGRARQDGRGVTGRRLVSLAALALTLGSCLAVGCQRADQPAQAPKAAPAAPPSFVGSAKCAGCHTKEAEAYRGSDHARAMQPATDQTVLGNFDQARVTHRGGTSTFFRRDGKFFVRTDGPDGKPGEFEIAYTFGVDPLQQYLVPFPDGRLQALGLAWDTRPRAQGGQRWFHLYPDVTLRAPDPLHWTGREQTWNFQCAECHSTDLRKRYDLATNRYATTWAELTVSCEECHGPGLGPRRLGRGAPGRGAPAAPGTTGLVVRLGRGDGTWTMKDSQRGIAEWTGARAVLGGARRLRPLPRAPAADRGSSSLRPALPRHPRAGAPRGPSVPRGRPDPGRGLRVGLVRPEPDAAGRGHLLGLPRAASRDAARGRQCGLRPVPPSGEVRRGEPPPPSARDRRPPAA